MITSTEIFREDGERIKVEVETAVPSDDVRIRFVSGSGNTQFIFIVTRKEASELRTCLSNI